MDDLVSSLVSRVAALEAELRDLRGLVSQPDQGTTLVCPVRISTPSGELVAEIGGARGERLFRLYNVDGSPVVTLGVDGTQSGVLAIRNREGVLVAYLNVESAGARLLLHDQQARGGLALFGGDSGDDAGGGINVMATSGGISAAIWSNLAGGRLELYTSDSDVPVLTLPIEPST